MESILQYRALATTYAQDEIDATQRPCAACHAALLSEIEIPIFDFGTDSARGGLMAVRSRWYHWLKYPNFDLDPVRSPTVEIEN